MASRAAFNAALATPRWRCFLSTTKQVILQSFSVLWAHLRKSQTKVEECFCLRFQSEKAQAPQDSRDPQMIVIAGRKPDSAPDRKISSAGDRDLLA